MQMWFPVAELGAIGPIEGVPREFPVPDGWFDSHTNVLFSTLR